MTVTHSPRLTALMCALLAVTILLAAWCLEPERRVLTVEPTATRIVVVLPERSPLIPPTWTATTLPFVPERIILAPMPTATSTPTPTTTPLPTETPTATPVKTPVMKG